MFRRHWRIKWRSCGNHSSGHYLRISRVVAFEGGRMGVGSVLDDDRTVAVFQTVAAFLSGQQLEMTALERRLVIGHRRLHRLDDAHRQRIRTSRRLDGRQSSGVEFFLQRLNRFLLLRNDSIALVQEDVDFLLLRSQIGFQQQQLRRQNPHLLFPVPVQTEKRFVLDQRKWEMERSTQCSTPKNRKLQISRPKEKVKRRSNKCTSYRLVSCRNQVLTCSLSRRFHATRR